jgi:VanZ family protein
MIKMVRKNILSIITALVILYLSLAPSDTFDKVSVFNFPDIDKVVHLLMYFGLTIVLIYENRPTVKSLRGLFLLAIIPFVYGILIEFLQSWFTLTRHGEFLDAVFDLIGIIIALAVWRLFQFFNIKKI